MKIYRHQARTEVSSYTGWRARLIVKLYLITCLSEDRTAWSTFMHPTSCESYHLLTAPFDNNFSDSGA